MLFVSFTLILLALIGLAACVEDCETCKYSTNACGEKYRGCYDSCKTKFNLAFPPPKCSPSVQTKAKAVKTPRSAKKTKTSSVHHPSSSTSTHKTTPKQTESITVTAPPVLIVTPASSSCTPSSICVDKINSCYMRYGGCYDANFCDGNTNPISTPACPTMTTVVR
ncbi:hypothetical protein MBLNU457_5169t1 [Dothideomycetes sp. NU457]